MFSDEQKRLLAHGSDLVSLVPWRPLCPPHGCAYPWWWPFHDQLPYPSPWESHVAGQRRDHAPPYPHASGQPVNSTQSALRMGRLGGPSGGTGGRGPGSEHHDWRLAEPTQLEQHQPTRRYEIIPTNVQHSRKKENQ